MQKPSQSLSLCTPVNQLERELICPITLQIFILPYMLRCGHTFEKKQLDNILRATFPSVCPLCRQQFNEADLIPNISLKNAATAYRRQYESSECRSIQGNRRSQTEIVPKQSDKTEKSQKKQKGPSTLELVLGGLGIGIIGLIAGSIFSCGSKKGKK